MTWLTRYIPPIKQDWLLTNPGLHTQSLEITVARLQVADYALHILFLSVEVPHTLIEPSCDKDMRGGIKKCTEAIPRTKNMKMKR